MQSRIDILIHLRKAKSPTTLDIMTNKLVRDAEAQNKPVRFIADIYLASDDRYSEIEAGKYCRGNIADESMAQAAANSAFTPELAR